MLKTTRCSGASEHNPLVEYYAQVITTTRYNWLREALITLFEVNNWELPEPFRQGDRQETLEEL